MKLREKLTMIRCELDNRMTKKYIMKNFSHILNEQQLNVATMYYADSPKTCPTIAKILNLSPSRIQQIVIRVTNRLNNAVANVLDTLPTTPTTPTMLTSEENLIMRKMLVDILN